jgi:hypothetical protein
MSEEIAPRRGPIEGTSRVLRELLRTPNFKKSIRIILNELDPENAAVLVRTLMWEDAELFLGLIGASPKIANAGITATRELAIQLAAFPPALIAGFLKGTVEEVDSEALGELLGMVLGIILTLFEMRDEGMALASRGFNDGLARGLAGSLGVADEDAGAREIVLEKSLPLLKARAAALGAEATRDGSRVQRLVKKTTEGIEELAEDNPDFIRGVVAPIVGAWQSALESAGGSEGKGGS